MMITYFFVFRMSQNINSIAGKIRLLSILKFRINFTYYTPILRLHLKIHAILNILVMNLRIGKILEFAAAE